MKQMKKTRTLACAFNIVLLLSMSLLGAPAQATTSTITQLFAFPCSPSGECPQGAEPNFIVQASDGNFYGLAGTTNINSGSASGTIYRITPSGTFTLLHTFKSSNGNAINPGTSLVEGNDGFLYGTTFDGGAANQGVLFRISKSGTGFKIVHSFCSQKNCADGASPTSLILGQDGNVYGVSLLLSAGSNIFRVTPQGTFTIALTFPNQNGSPFDITQGADGNFYAVTLSGVLTAVERITPQGHTTILGKIPFQGVFPCHGSTNLLQVADGDLFGMMGCYSIEQAQFYKVSLSGGLQEFPQLGHSTNLIAPIQASDGNLWTILPDLDEVIVAPPSTGTISQSFPFDGNGSNAETPVVQGADGKIYGTASLGGTGQNATGTVWVLDAGLAPPEATLAVFTPTKGVVGGKVLIRGDHFIDTTAVTFDGVSASFTVLNRNFISATVPAGATSGPIAVTNPGGTIASKQNFAVE
jgi:uncharacterized repeat protein (TIGR03803 family)